MSLFAEVAHVGSSLGCGCGFRSVSLQNGAWPEEWVIEDGECAPSERHIQDPRELDALAPSLMKGGGKSLARVPWESWYEVHTMPAMTKRRTVTLGRRTKRRKAQVARPVSKIGVGTAHWFAPPLLARRDPFCPLPAGRQVLALLFRSRFPTPPPARFDELIGSIFSAIVFGNRAKGLYC